MASLSLKPEPQPGPMKLPEQSFLLEPELELPVLVLPAASLLELALSLFLRPLPSIHPFSFLERDFIIPRLPFALWRRCHLHETLLDLLFELLGSQIDLATIW